jgi:hypothetical protein
MRSRWITLAPIMSLLAGCTSPNTIAYLGERMDQYFVFDGDRSWEFISDDTSLPYLMIGDLQEEFVSINEGSTRIYTIRYKTDCLGAGECDDGAFIWSLDLSFDSIYGAQIHGITVGSEPATVFDPAVVLTTPYINQGDVFETVSGGVTYTSTFIGFEQCPVQWNVDWPKCVHFTLDDGGAGTPLAGDYWANVGFNLVAMDMDMDESFWQLLSAKYD